LIRYKKALQMRVMNHLRKTSDGTWEVRLVVPLECRAVMGRNNLTKRLGRISPSEANRLAVPVVAEFQARIAEARISPAERQRAAERQDESLKAMMSDKLRRWENIIDVAMVDAEQAALSAPAKPVSLAAMFADYASEAGLAPATVKRWKPCIDHLIAHIGHDNAASVTPADILSWKNELQKDRSQATVRNAYLGSVKATFTWGIGNLRVTSNPVVGIKVRVPQKKKTRSQGFLPDEARLILKTALTGDYSHLSEHYQRAFRWVPWVCAYTGARVGEITQMRGIDVFERDGHWVMDITPEAGGTKTGHARLVPVHRHLIELGFLAMVAEVGDGALFYNSRLARGGSAANPHHKKVGERLASWVRDIGVNDPRIQPNHGWRHLFTTLSRNANIDPEARDILKGSVPRTESEKYGDYDLSPLIREYNKFPRFKVE